MNRFFALINVLKCLSFVTRLGLLAQVFLQWLGTQGTIVVTYFHRSLIAHALNLLHLLVRLITDLSLGPASLVTISRSPCSTASKLLPQFPQELLIRVIFPQFIIFDEFLLIK